MQKLIVSVILVLVLITAIVGVSFLLSEKDGSTPPDAAAPSPRSNTPDHQPTTADASPLPDTVVNESPALKLSDPSSVEAALDAVIAALEQGDERQAVTLARSIRLAGEDVAAYVAGQLFENGGIDDRALESRFRIVALCLSADDPQLSQLLLRLMSNWLAGQLVPENEKSWKNVEQQPTDVNAYKALRPDDLLAMNGLMQALVSRRRSGEVAETDELWAKLWRILTASEYTSDPLISTAIFHWSGWARSEEMPTEVVSNVKFVRDNGRFSLRLRVQAAILVAPESATLLELVTNLAAAVSHQDRVKLLSDYLKKAPELTTEDWSILLAALIEGRNAGLAVQHAFLAAGRELWRAGRAQEYADSLLSLYLDPSQDENVSRLGGGALAHLVMASTVVHFKSPSSVRQRLLPTADAEQVLAELLNRLKSAAFKAASEDVRMGHISRTLYIMFELSLPMNKRVEVAKEVLAACASTREIDSAQTAFLGPLFREDDRSLIEGGTGLLEIIIEYLRRSIDMYGDLDKIRGDVLEGRKAMGYCIGVMRALSRVAELQAFPPLDSALSDLKTIHEVFETALDVVSEGVRGSELRSIQHNADIVRKAEVLLASHYNMPWIDN
jgi:hypothetical protein